MRFFLPLSFLLLSLATLKTTRDLIVLGRIGSLAVIIGLTGIQVFVAGILADVMVRHFSGVAVRPIRRSPRLRPAKPIPMMSPPVEIARREAR
jgi:hypothetical protein